MSRIIVLLLTIAPFGMFAQEWETKTFADFSFAIPVPNKLEQALNGAAYSHRGESLYLTVTMIPDTTDFKPDTKLEFSRYYAMRLNAANLRLRAKLQEVTDTIIGDKSLNYSSSRYLTPDSTVMHYDLLQYYRQDTLFGFACQFNPAVKSNMQMRDQFFNRIEFQFAEKKGLPADRSSLYILGGTVLFLILIFYLYSRNGAREAALAF